MTRTEILARLEALSAEERAEFAKQDLLAALLKRSNEGWARTEWVRNERGPLVRALNALPVPPHEREASARELFLDGELANERRMSDTWRMRVESQAAELLRLRLAIARVCQAWRQLGSFPGQAMVKEDHPELGRALALLEPTVLT